MIFNHLHRNSGRDPEFLCSFLIWVPPASRQREQASCILEQVLRASFFMIAEGEGGVLSELQTVGHKKIGELFHLLALQSLYFKKNSAHKSHLKNFHVNLDLMTFILALFYIALILRL